MVLWLVDHFSNLSRRHYLVIVVTIVVPVVFPTFMGYFEIERLWVRLVIDVSVIVAWAVFVVVVVSRLVERDTSEANQLIAENVAPVVAEVRGFREEHGNLIADLNLKVEDLAERTDAALQPLGGKLGPRGIRIRATVSTGVPTVSASLTVSGGSRWGRFRAWFRRVRQRAWGILWGRRQLG